VYQELKLQVNQITPIFKIKNGGGLLWSKLSAEIPQCRDVRETMQRRHPLPSLQRLETFFNAKAA